MSDGNKTAEKIFFASPNSVSFQPESPTTSHPAIEKEPAFNKSTSLKAQLTQQLNEINQLEYLQAQLSQLKKFCWSGFVLSSRLFFPTN